MPARRLVAHAAPPCHRGLAGLRALVHPAFPGHHPDRPTRLPARLAPRRRRPRARRVLARQGMASRRILPAPLQRHPHRPTNRTRAGRHGQPARHRPPVPGKGRVPRHLRRHVGIRPAQGPGSRKRRFTETGRLDGRPQTTAPHCPRHRRPICHPRHPQWPLPRRRLRPHVHTLACHRLSHRYQNHPRLVRNGHPGRLARHHRNPPVRQNPENRRTRPAHRRRPPARNRPRSRRWPVHLRNRLRLARLHLPRQSRRRPQRLARCPRHLRPAHGQGRRRTRLPRLHRPPQRNRPGPHSNSP